MVSIIPAIDILDGKLVRLTKGDYSQTEFYEKTPWDMAKEFEDFGAKRIHIVDLNGAKEGKLINRDCLQKIRNNTRCELEIGGGIRSLETANSLFDLGFNYCILGSLLAKNISLATEIITHFPNQIIAGIDAKDQLVATEGWLETGDLTIKALISTLSELPIKELIYTDINRDGTLEGVNISALNEVCNSSPFPVIASGGIGTQAHLEQLFQDANQNCIAVIVGKALLSQKIPLSKDLF